MKNPYQIEKVKIVRVFDDAPGVRLAELRFNKAQAKGWFVPGQFIIISLPGYGEAPFAICSSPLKTDGFEICVRRVGGLTNKLNSLSVGAEIGFRGPYGNGFPLGQVQERNTLVVAGGVGMVPFRSIIEYFGECRECFPRRLEVFYGVRNSGELLFEDRYKEWSKFLKLHLTLDKKNGPVPEGEWSCNFGLITELFSKVKIGRHSIALVCGPPVMCYYVIKELKKRRFADKDIYLSMERRMDCGFGVCQHCAIGPYYVCKDGPVFTWEQIKDIPDVLG